MWIFPVWFRNNNIHPTFRKMKVTFIKIAEVLACKLDSNTLRKVARFGGLAALLSHQLQATTLNFGVVERVEFTTQPFHSYVIETLDNNVWSANESILGDGYTHTSEVEVSDPVNEVRISEFPVADISAELEQIRERNELPGLLLLAWKDGRFIAQGATGNRKQGVESQITIADKCHIGSITKSMTATLIGILVDEGLIHWNTNLSDVFGDSVANLNPDFGKVTVQQLMVHRSGIDDNSYNNLWNQLWRHQGTPFQQRRFLLSQLASSKPAYDPGSHYSYSNYGFAMAGHIAETVTGIPWERLIQEKLFDPLGITSAGFGAPVMAQYVNAPMGHRWVNGRNIPVEAGIDADNPPAIAPAGTVHISLEDLIRYARLHLSVDSENAGLGIVSPETLSKLQTPIFPQDEYAMGWFSLDRSWAGNLPALAHDGSNLQHFMSLWISRSKKFIAVAYTNTAQNGNEGVDQSVGLVVEKCL